MLAHRDPTTVYTIYFAYRYFRDFGLGGEIHAFSDVFIKYKKTYIEVEIFARSDSRNSQKWNHRKNNHVYSNECKQAQTITNNSKLLFSLKIYAILGRYLYKK